MKMTPEELGWSGRVIQFFYQSSARLILPFFTLVFLFFVWIRFSCCCLNYLIHIWSHLLSLSLRKLIAAVVKSLFLFLFQIFSYKSQVLWCLCCFTFSNVEILVLFSEPTWSRFGSWGRWTYPVTELGEGGVQPEQVASSAKGHTDTNTLYT